LEQLVRRRTPQRSMVIRAKMVLASGQGLSIRRICERYGLDQQVVRRWIKRYDKLGFDGLKDYLRPPADTTLLSIDAKPGIQALRRVHATRPLKSGSPARIEFEYERKRTRNLFAAFNIKTGRVLAWCTLERSTPWVLSFLDQILRWVRRGPIILINDNISTRTGAAAQSWLSAHPVSGSSSRPSTAAGSIRRRSGSAYWTSKALRHRSFDSLRALERAIYRFPGTGTTPWPIRSTKPTQARCSVPLR
jgi:hypothetical protein